MNIGFIAHESKKKLLQNFCIAYRGILSRHELYATGTSGRLIEEAANLSGSQIPGGACGRRTADGSMIEQNEIDLMIFLRDPFMQKKRDPDPNKIFRLCDVHIIPLATNLASAEMLIKSLERGELDWRENYK